MAESNCRPTESQEGFRVEVGFGPGQEAGQIWSRGGGGGCIPGAPVTWALTSGTQNTAHSSPPCESGASSSCCAVTGGGDSQGWNSGAVTEL